MSQPLGRPYLPGGAVRLIIHAASPAEYAPFAPFHYLPGHGSIARCYLAEIDRQPAGWISTIRAVGHPGWRVHRLVVLPAFRGRGVGSVLVRWVADREPGPVSIRTRQGGFVDSLLAGGDGWRPTRHSGDRTTPDARTGSPGGLARTAVRAESVTSEIVCQHCGGPCRTTRAHTRFCSGRCRMAAHRRTMGT